MVTTKAGPWFSEVLLVENLKKVEQFEKLENLKKVGKLGKKSWKNWIKNGKLFEVE